MFDTIDVPGSLSAGANGINSHGQIVGTYSDLSTFHGFLAQMDTVPPVITVSASPDALWPPNGRLVPVTVSGVIADGPGGSHVNEGSAAYAVLDEYGLVQPHGILTLGADGRYIFTLALEASRRGSDHDGRRYTVTVSAEDQAGNRGFTSMVVTVPHSMGK